MPQIIVTGVSPDSLGWTREPVRKAIIDFKATFWGLAPESVKVDLPIDPSTPRDCRVDVNVILIRRWGRWWWRRHRFARELSKMLVPVVRSVRDKWEVGQDRSFVPVQVDTLCTPVWRWNFATATESRP